MKPSQRKSPGVPAGKPPVPLTEAQTTFAVVLGQCLAKEWMRLMAARRPSFPTDLPDQAATSTRSGTLRVAPK